MFSSSRKAFTMIELTFAIVIIGILASVAIPRLAATRDDAEIVAAKTTVSALRTAIATERQKRVLRGNFDAITGLEAVNLLAYSLGADWDLPTSVNSYFTFTGPGNTECKFLIEDNKFVKKTCNVLGMEHL